jgi:hypothetical protein
MDVANIIRWTARGLSLGSGALLVAFLGPGEAMRPTPAEIVGLALFPGGVLLGFVLGWWRPKVGGVVALASLAAFYAWHVATAGRWPAGPWFLLFTSPALLFLAAAWLPRQRASG